MAAQSRQIDLLFGVKGGGSVNGESGQRIQSQINGIVSGLKAAKIKVDYTAVLRAHKQLEQLSKQIDVLNGKKIKLTSGGNAIFNIKNSGGVLSEAETLYKQIQRISNGLPAAEARVAGFNQQLAQTKIVVSDLTRVKSLIGPLLNKQGTLISFSGAKTHLDEMRNIVGAYGQYIKHVKAAATANQHHNLAIKNADANLRAMYSSLKSNVNSLGRNKTKLLNMDDTIPEVKQAKTLIASLEAEVVKFKTAAGTVKPINFFGNNSTNSDAMKAFLSSSDLQKLPAAIAAATKANTTYGKSVTSLEAQVKKVQRLIYSFGSKESKLLRLDKDLIETKQLQQALVRLKQLASTFTSATGKVVPANKMTPEQIANLREYLNLYDALPVKVNAATTATHKLKARVSESLLASKALSQVWGSFNKMKGIDRFPEIKQSYLDMMAQLEGKTKLNSKEAAIFADNLKRLENRAFKAGAGIRSFTQELDIKLLEQVRHLISSFATMFVVQGFRTLYRNVLEVDTAMTELKKVTEATSREYVEFLDGASERAKKLGASLTEVINASADYARMGYNIKDASQLADTAIIYHNVGDGLQDIDEATSHLISTMTAFGYAASDSMHIVDIFNEVANNYAVTAADIGTGIKKSAASMQAAGNSLEETVALFTTANTIAQDADVVGTALKTVSMRLRSTKIEMEEAGEDTEGMASTVSSLREQLLALTGVDIQLDDGTYKSTYQMLKELSEVWDELSDKDQSAITEKLFGKKQGNIGLAILENFELANEVLATALDSSGSALEENEKYLESIQGHLDQLSASFQTFAQNFLDSEFVKTVIDLLRGILDFFNEIIVSGEKMLGVIGQTTGAILSLVAALTALDMLWGFKHVPVVTKNIMGFVTSIKTLIACMDFKNITSSLELMSLDGVKGADALLKIGKVLIKVTSSFAFWGVTIAAVLVLLGQWNQKVHSASHQLEKMKESVDDYKETETVLESYEEALQKNKDKLEELKKTPWADRTKAQQDEISRIEDENELLAAQVEYYKELKEYKADETRADIVKSMDKTHGYHYVGGIGKVTHTGSGSGYYTETQVNAILDEYELRKDAYLREMENGDAWTNKEEWAKSVQAKKDYFDLIAAELEELKTNFTTTYDNLFEFVDPEDEEAMTKLRELAKGLQELGLWTEEHTAESIEFFNIDEFDKFEEIKNYIDSIDNISFEDLISSGVFKIDEINNLKIALDAAGISWEEFVDWCNQADEASDIEGSINIDTEGINAASEATKNLSSSCKTLADAFKEQNENGSLSVDTILDAIDAGYAAALVVDQETGAVKLNADMYKYLAQMKINDQIISLNTQKTSLMDSKLLLEEAVAAGKAAEGYATLAETKAALAQVEAHIAGIEAQIVALNNLDVDKITQGIYGIGDAASSAKSKLSNLQSGMENLLSQTISWLKQEYNDAQEAQEKYYESQIDALEDAKDAAKDRWDAEKEAIEDAKDSYNDLIDAQIELLKRQKEADDYAKNRAEKEDAVADIENQLLAIENDDSIEAQKMRLELQEQLKEAKDELEELQSDREYELREQALQDEKDRYNDEIDAKLDAINKQSEAEEKAYQDRIDRLQKYLDAVRDSEKTEAQWRAEAYDWIQSKEEALYQELIEWNRIYGVTTLPLSGNRH